MKHSSPLGRVLNLGIVAALAIAFTTVTADALSLKVQLNGSVSAKNSGALCAVGGGLFMLLWGLVMYLPRRNPKRVAPPKRDISWAKVFLSVLVLTGTKVATFRSFPVAGAKLGQGPATSILIIGPVFVTMWKVMGQKNVTLRWKGLFAGLGTLVYVGVLNEVWKGSAFSGLGLICAVVSLVSTAIYIVVLEWANNNDVGWEALIGASVLAGVVLGVWVLRAVPVETWLNGHVLFYLGLSSLLAVPVTQGLQLLAVSNLPPGGLGSWGAAPAATSTLAAWVINRDAPTMLQLALAPVVVYLAAKVAWAAPPKEVPAPTPVPPQTGKTVRDQLRTVEMAVRRRATKPAAVGGAAGALTAVIVILGWRLASRRGTSTNIPILPGK